MTALKNRNRTLLEVDTGIAILALAVTVLWTLLPHEEWKGNWIKYIEGFYRSVWMAAMLTVFSYLHMYRSLDRALDHDEGSAQKLIFRGYVTRYVAIAVILVLAAVTEWFNPLILCLGYLLFMKGAAYLQPSVHRLYNFLFHEKDPVPEPLADEIPAVAVQEDIGKKKSAI